MNNSNLARLQAVSGLLFSLFALVHPFDNDFARAYEAATAYFAGDDS